MTQNVFKAINLVWRAMVIAIGYTLALMLSGMVLGMLGLLQGDMSADAAPVFLWMFLGAVIMALTLGILAPKVPASAARHVVIWTVLLFANIGSVIIEGYFFVPDLVTNVWATVAQQFLPCLVTAVLVYRLFAPRPAETPARTLHRPWYHWLWRYSFECRHLSGSLLAVWFDQLCPGNTAVLRSARFPLGRTRSANYPASRTDTCRPDCAFGAAILTDGANAHPSPGGVERAAAVCHWRHCASDLAGGFPGAAAAAGQRRGNLLPELYDRCGGGAVTGLANGRCHDLPSSSCLIHKEGSCDANTTIFPNNE